MPLDIVPLLQQAIAALQSGNDAEVERHCQAILGADFEHFEAAHILGQMHFRRGRYEPAAHWFARAIMLQPGHASAHDFHGMALAELGHPEDAIKSYDRAIVLSPDFADAHFHRGNAMVALGHWDSAVNDFSQAIAHAPGYWQAFYNRGVALMNLKCAAEAMASFDATILLQPGMAEAFNNRGAALNDLDRPLEAKASFDQALALAPQMADAYSNRGNAFFALGDYAQASSDFNRAIALGSQKPFLKGARFHARMHMCDWNNLENDAAELVGQIDRGQPVAAPFVILPIASSARTQRICAETFIRHEYPMAAMPLWNGEFFNHPRIRLAYISGAFRHHPTAVLAGGLFARHDRSRFETIAISFSKDDSSPARQHLESAFEHFIDVRGNSDKAIATQIRALEVDIAVDLDGLIQNARPGIFAHRPAPIQVSYLGFPATMGAPYIDYILADRIVVPEQQRDAFVENIVYLPETYQPNTNRSPAGSPPTRQDCGLPPDAFVFCCFNSPYKITPDIFDIWMRLLGNTPGSVLWLLESGDGARANLIRETEARGIAPSRLVFAPVVSLEENLARQPLGDLFLDTFYYNAHTTASDALWAGLPLLTCPGTTFSSRVAASLLTAIGMPELIARTRDEYERLALTFFSEPETLAAIRARLQHNRADHPLFNSNRIVRHLDKAYETMIARLQNRLLPEGFTVSPMD